VTRCDFFTVWVIKFNQNRVSEDRANHTPSKIVRSIKHSTVIPTTFSFFKAHLAKFSCFDAFVNRKPPINNSVYLEGNQIITVDKFRDILKFHKSHFSQRIFPTKQFTGHLDWHLRPTIRNRSHGCKYIIYDSRIHGLKPSTKNDKNGSDENTTILFLGMAF
jgi:hypothetical protein